MGREKAAVKWENELLPVSASQACDTTIFSRMPKHTCTIHLQAPLPVSGLQCLCEICCMFSLSPLHNLFAPSTGGFGDNKYFHTQHLLIDH